MKVSCKFVSFHAPVFSAGKNFGDKIHANNQTGVKFTYDTDLRMMIMEYKNTVTMFDSFHAAEIYNPADVNYAISVIAPSPIDDKPIHHATSIKGKSKFIKNELTDNQGE